MFVKSTSWPGDCQINVDNQKNCFHVYFWVINLEKIIIIEHDSEP